MTKHNAIVAIMNSLNEVFAPMDAEVLAATKVWAAGRVAAIKEFKADAENAKLARSNQHAYYTRLFDIAGGKTWYNVFNGRNTAMIEDFVEKNCKAIADKRNAGIAKKLEQAGVTEVTETTYTHTTDGFNGVFGVNTNAGRKSVTVDTIRAGGYNIQCLHLRVLTKVR